MTKTFLTILAAAALAFAHDEHAKGKEITVTGLVVDTGCYMAHNSTGSEHETCATACAKKGVPLAILDQASGKLYMAVAADHKNQNDKLMPFVEKKVKATGILLENGGIKGLAIKTVVADTTP